MATPVRYAVSRLRTELSLAWVIWTIPKNSRQLRTDLIYVAWRKPDGLFAKPC
jgi:hypothetical protein